jgi:dihydrodipicolinate synthase/N-acetylneuraminate lyase
VRKDLTGIFVAAVTPRRAQQHDIDLGATLELIDFLGTSGVDGIALLGSTGEFVHFAIEDRQHMVNLAAKRSRVPLVVNVSHSTLDGALELARGAAGAGVEGVLVMPPYYFRQSQPAIRAFYLKFAAEIGTATPIYLYNIPSCTTEIDSGVAAELLATGLFAGIKDSSGSLDYFRALAEQAEKTPVTLFAGHERIYGQCKAMGAKGIVSGVASALPELMVAIDRAINAGDQERVATLDALLAEFLQRVEIFPWPAGVKHAAKHRQLKTGALASPLGPEGERRLAEFGEWFDGWLPGVLRACGR